MSYRVRNLLSQTPGKISVTTDSWSSHVLKGYIAVTAHRISTDWKLHSIILDLKRFVSPQTGEATCTMLMEILNDWNLENKLMTVTIDNASEVCNALKRMHSALVQ